MNKETKELLKGAENYIVVSEEGISVQGNAMHLLTQYTILTKTLAQQTAKEVMDTAYELAFLSEKELEKRTLEAIKGFMERINKMSEDK